MSDAINPYIPGRPVDNPKLFFGRREILASIRENLVKGRRVFAVSGPPRMGLSSLLRQIPHHLPEDFLAVRLDLIDEGQKHLDWLLWYIADSIDKQVGSHLGTADPSPDWREFEAHTEKLLDDYWPRVRAALDDRGLILILDDLDDLDRDGDLLDPLLTLLASWREQEDGLAVVLGTSETLQESLVREHPQLLGGALTYNLGALNSEESARLITWPVDGVLTYDYGVSRRLVELTSGQPYYLQLLCFELYNRCAPAGWVNQLDVDLVMEDLVGREISDFREMWDESSSPERATLAALVSLRGARGIATVQEARTILTKAGARVQPEQVADALESLADRGILERLGALSYRFRVALLRDWLCERIDLAEIVQKTRWDETAPGKAGAQAGVVKLSTRRSRRKERQARADQAGAGKEDGEHDDAPKAGRPWIWVGAAVILALVLLVVVGPPIYRSLAPEPTPTATLSPSPAARLATATLTAGPAETEAAVTSEPVAVASATPTPLPEPTATPSPTPPVVVARSVPSIAYQSREQGEDTWYIHVMSSDGSDRVRLVVGQSAFLSAPTWSPDGSRIAFASDQSDNADIWVMDTDGGNLVNITNHEAKDHSPAWSPDGDWIAFASVRDSLYWELYLMRPDGTDVQRLTWWEDASDLSPTWSPDATRLAFASKRDGNWEIYTMDREGDNLVRLTDDPADDTNPAWSPDGSRIAFASTRDGYAEIYITTVLGGEAVNISNAPYSTEHGPTWSPDGGRLAFYSDRDGGWNIHIMGSDGSDPIKLTSGNSNDQVPAWRP